jgi:DNA-binding GntR family transcriptional regulator
VNRSRISGISPEVIFGAPPERQTVGTAAYTQLREAILRGKIAMGTRINELELAGAWNVSRTPIRDALRRLEAEGLVRAIPGRGVVVPALSPVEADELYELREVLETRAARRAAERVTPEFHARLNGLIKAFGTALKQGDIQQLTDIDHDLHAGIAAISGNTRLGQAIEAVRAQIYQVRVWSMEAKGRAQKSFREMAKLIAAIRARNGPRAEAAMREHIASLRTDLPTVWHEDSDFQ